MCGIVGALGSYSNHYTKSSIDTIGHRGPDDSGCWFDDKIFLGHTRLSILDTSNHGHQPMVYGDNEYVLVYNGEIYNHLEIRKKLSDKYSFNSTSDTETLLYALIEYGVEILNDLRGIFSFAFYNSKDKSVILTRDQFGIKPLYYYINDNSIYFSSEIKAFLTLDNFNQTVNYEGLMNHLAYLYSPGEVTCFKEVKKMLPGHYMKIYLDGKSSNDYIPTQYYKPIFNGDRFNYNEDTIIDMVDNALTKAVERQLLSDVPLGFFLSGGLDSSILVAIARKLNPERKITCFTIDTSKMDGEDDFTNDFYYAQKIAEILDVDLVPVEGCFDILKDFDHMIYSLDEPQADPAALHVHNICKKAKKMGIKVLVGGTGGDDIFSGYRRHQAIRVQSIIESLPLFLRKAIKTLFRMIPINNTLFRRLKKLTSSLDSSLLDRLSSYYSWQDPKILKDLFSDEVKENFNLKNPLQFLVSSVDQIPDEGDLLNKMLYWEMISFLPDHNLNYTDKMSMATGVEVRVPFLDLDLVELATKIPTNMKMNGNKTKYILKKVAERYLPKDIIYRKKTGFGGPVRDWVKNDLRTKMQESFIDDKNLFSKIFNISKIEKLIEMNDRNSIDASYTLFCLYAINSWIKQFVDCQEVVKS